MDMTIEEAIEIMKGFPKSLETDIGELSKEGYLALSTISKALNNGYTLTKSE